MVHEISLAHLPDVTGIYSVRRRTVWQIVDPDTLLIFAAEGRCRITLDRDEYILSEGSMMLIPAGHQYVRRPFGDEMCTLYYAHMRLHDAPIPMERIEAASVLHARRQRQVHAQLYGEKDASFPPDPPHTCFIAPLSDLSAKKDEILTLWHEGIAAASSNHADSMTLTSVAMLRVLLLASLRDGDIELPAEELPPIDEPHRKLRRVVTYIRLHAKEAIKLDDLCAVCNFSKQHLIRVFREEFGKTPKAYILEYKINVAKEIIFRDPYLSVKMVADEMGFEDQHYFSRLFTKVTGVTPTAYKQHLLTFDPSKQ